MSARVAESRPLIPVNQTCARLPDVSYLELAATTTEAMRSGATWPAAAQAETGGRAPAGRMDASAGGTVAGTYLQEDARHAPAGDAAALHGWNFVLPPELEAGEPPEVRGLARDEVRLMISDRAADAITHTIFRDLPCYLDPGDLLVINTSGTMNASLPATGPGGSRFELHLSTHLPGGLWSVELRRAAGPAAGGSTAGGRGTLPYYDAHSGEVYELPAGARAALLAPYGGGDPSRAQARTRLWLAGLHLPLPLPEYLARWGSPIHYGYVPRNWPSQYYQTVYATELGSAEMPSAGRAFSPDVLTRLAARGVWIAPLILHTGVASLEEDELPYEEFYRIPSGTAYLINAARARGKRVIAVGTTVVRAVETAAAEDGAVHPGEGWTGLVVTPGYRMAAITGLLTGLHEPRSTHLAMLQALAGREHLRLTYAAALRERYLWHEFGDLHLIL